MPRSVSRHKASLCATHPPAAPSRYIASAYAGRVVIMGALILLQGAHAAPMLLLTPIEQGYQRPCID